MTIQVIYNDENSSENMGVRTKIIKNLSSSTTKVPQRTSKDYDQAHHYIPIALFIPTLLRKAPAQAQVLPI